MSHIGSLEKELAARADHARSQEEALASREKQVRSLEKELAARADHARSQEEALASREKQVRSLEKELAARADHAHSQEEALASREKHVRQLGEQIDQLCLERDPIAEALNSTRAELNCIKDGLGWKVLTRVRTLKEALLPEDSRRRKLYDGWRKGQMR